MAPSYFSKLSARDFIYENLIGQRINWLDNNFPGVCNSTPIDDAPTISNSGVSVFPSPIIDYVIFDVFGHTDCLITLSDVTGREVYKSTPVAAGQFVLNCNFLQSGVYLYSATQATNGKVISNGKLLKQ
ncbi:MAG: hypothetical protein IPO27_12885 [Bacteroidetes bacterium]|nr:hypothetical protein [Bacteroidota bacterium]